MTQHRALTLPSIIFANMRHNALSCAFNIALLAIGMAIVMTLSHLHTQMQRQFDRDLKGIDLVVGGKGSPLQIILSSVFHLDVPTGNIPYDDAMQLAKNQMIKKAIPLSLGDNYNGYRIVGSNADLISHYGAEMAQGRMFDAQMEVVLGSTVAAQYHLRLNDQIIGAHGLSNSDDLHSDAPYTVVGILKPTGAVIDRLVVTPTESVWHVHEHPDADDPEEVAYKKAHPEKEITALLISYRTPFAMVQLPRIINATGRLQAASPAFEVARLTRMMGAGGDALTACGAVMIGFAGLGFFVTLYNAMRERRYDIALMRAIGASRGKVFGLVVGEAMVMGIGGVVAGIALTYGLLRFSAGWLEHARHITLEGAKPDCADLFICMAAVGLSILAGLLPAWRAYRVDAVKTLVG